MWFAVLCLIAGGIPLGILYVLFGPTRPSPVVPIPRMHSRLATVPAAPTTRRYEPERVFATEQRALIANATSIALVAPRDAVPRPLPRARAARGSDAPPARELALQSDSANPFADESPTMVGLH